MVQLNLHVTPELLADLRRLQRLRRLSSKVETVCMAVRETLERELPGTDRANFHEWLGLGFCAPVNPTPQFVSHAKLWAHVETDLPPKDDTTGGR